MVSGVLGFLRDVMTAAVLGTGMIADPFVVDHAGAEHGGDQDVAQEAEDTAHHAEPADRREGAVESHGALD